MQISPSLQSSPETQRSEDNVAEIDIHLTAKDIILQPYASGLEKKLEDYAEMPEDNKACK
jgi:hypothetical protein